MNEINVTNEDLKKHFNSITDLYEAQTPTLSFSALIMGLFGVGKTRFILTGPKPWLIDSFDPKGTLAVEMEHQEDIKNGNLVIRKFWNERSGMSMERGEDNKPSEYARWEKIHKKDMETGFLNYFGTYSLDSFTTWLDACANAVSVYQGRNRKVQKLAQTDYQIIYDLAKDFVKESSSQDCNFIVTAHLQDYMDVNDRRVTQLKAYAGLRTDIPLLFSEKYVLETEETSQGIRYNLYTRSAGTFRASTQLGSEGKLKDVEVPDLREILKKTGFNYEDKKPLKEIFK